MRDLDGAPEAPFRPHAVATALQPFALDPADLRGVNDLTMLLGEGRKDLEPSLDVADIHEGGGQQTEVQDLTHGEGRAGGGDALVELGQGSTVTAFASREARQQDRAVVRPRGEFMPLGDGGRALGACTSRVVLAHLILDEGRRGEGEDERQRVGEALREADGMPQGDGRPVRIAQKPVHPRKMEVATGAGVVTCVVCPTAV